MFELERAYWSGFFKRLFGKGNTPVAPVNTLQKPVEPPKTLYTEFDPQDTLPDAIFGGFDESFDMQGFFERKGSYLATYKVGGKGVPQIINDACKPYNVNQKYIMILLQKEMGSWSLQDVTKLKSHSVFTRYKDSNGNYVKKADGTFDRKEFVINPVEWCLGFGVPDDDPPNPRFQGFDNQITNCARRVRQLFDQGPSQVGKKFRTLGYTVLTDALLKGRTDAVKKQMAINQKIHLDYVKEFGLELSGDPEKYIVVTLKNNWAWLLYMYTPHVGAQKLTHKLWNQEWANDLNLYRA